MAKRLRGLVLRTLRELKLAQVKPGGGVIRKARDGFFKSLLRQVGMTRRQLLPSLDQFFPCGLGRVQAVDADDAALALIQGLQNELADVGAQP